MRKSLARVFRKLADAIDPPSPARIACVNPYEILAENAIRPLAERWVVGLLDYIGCAGGESYKDCDPVGWFAYCDHLDIPFLLMRCRKCGGYCARDHADAAELKIAHEALGIAA